MANAREIPGGAVRVAIVGVGNCASAFVQGLVYYAEPGAGDSGIMMPEIGGYTISDIYPVAAFDVNERKVGQYLSDAIWAEPNCCVPFLDEFEWRSDINESHAGNVIVQQGPESDGVAQHYRDTLSPLEPSGDDQGRMEVVAALRESKTDVLINFLPVGSEKASHIYARAALEAGVAFVNCIPTFIASDPEGYFFHAFDEAGLPLLGDDIKSQVGATITHRTLMQMIERQGQEVTSSYQLNVGGNTDFQNMLDRSRLEMKRESKQRAVTSAIPYDFDMYAGPSDYVPHLHDMKVCFIRIEGTQFGGVPFEMDIKLKVHDSPNSAGVVHNAVRVAKAIMDKYSDLDPGLKTSRRAVRELSTLASACFFKHPLTQMDETYARGRLQSLLNIGRE
jgi:myo-inositol-1-phosphate synthase